MSIEEDNDQSEDTENNNDVAEEFAITWARSYGGLNPDNGMSIITTPDEGFIICGDAQSFPIEMPSDFPYGWIMKIDTFGALVWQKAIGRDYDHTIGYSIIRNDEGNYLIAGGEDFPWALKITNEGLIIWRKFYGPTEGSANSIVQTDEGGFIMAGWRQTEDREQDLWVLKTDKDGEIEWQKSYGGAIDDRAYSIKQTQDGGFIVGGYSTSFGAGEEDVWILQLDRFGEVVWQRSLGGEHDDRAISIIQTSDGRFLVSGWSGSFGEGELDSDSWIIMLEEDGSVRWQRRFGGSDTDWSNSIIERESSDFIVGATRNLDIWVFAIDGNGNILWESLYRSDNSADNSNTILETSDEGLVISGYSYDFDSSWYNYDVYILKMDEAGRILSNCSSIVFEMPISHALDTPALILDTEAVSIETDAAVMDWPYDAVVTDASVITVCGE